MKLYRCGMPDDGSDPIQPATPGGFGFMWRLDARDLCLPRFSRLDGPVNGGDWRYGDVGMSAAEFDRLADRWFPAGAAPAAFLIDLADTGTPDPAAHAYLSTILDRIKVRFPKTLAGILDSAALASLGDFAAPDLSPLAPIGMTGSPQWWTFESWRKAMAARIVVLAAAERPMIGVLSSRYLYPGPLHRQAIGEPELSIALELLGSARADLAILNDCPQTTGELRDFRGVVRRVREIVNPGCRVEQVASAPAPV